MGDPDLAVYGFRGAGGLGFQGVPAERRTVLARSCRLPRAVHELATTWIAQIRDHESVVFAPRDADGLVRRLTPGGPRLGPLVRSVRKDLHHGRSGEYDPLEPIPVGDP